MPCECRPRVLMATTVVFIRYKNIAYASVVHQMLIEIAWKSSAFHSEDRREIHYFHAARVE